MKETKEMSVLQAQQEAQGPNEYQPLARLTVSCGANTEVLEDAGFTSLATLRQNMREVLNIGDDHNLVLINGKEVGQVDEGKVMLNGDETVEFKKPSGRKG